MKMPVSEPIGGLDFGTDSPVFPWVSAGLVFEVPFFDSPPLPPDTGGGVWERSPFFPFPLPLFPLGTAGALPLDFPLPLLGVGSPLVIAFTVFLVSS